MAAGCSLLVAKAESETSWVPEKIADSLSSYLCCHSVDLHLIQTFLFVGSHRWFVCRMERPVTDWQTMLLHSFDSSDHSRRLCCPHSHGPVPGFSQVDSASSCFDWLPPIPMTVPAPDLDPASNSIQDMAYYSAETDSYSNAESCESCSDWHSGAAGCDDHPWEVGAVLH